MTIPLNGSTIAIAILILTNLATIYGRLRNPQIKTDLATQKLQEEMNAQKSAFEKEVLELKKEILEMKTMHIAGMEKDMKDLTASISALKNELTRLSTILDERIPKKI